VIAVEVGEAALLCFCESIDRVVEEVRLS
jgi:hypothetical protein